MCNMVLKEWSINQGIAAVIVSFGGFGTGLGLSWTATALPSFEETGDIGSLTSNEKSWIASLLTVGAMMACPITGLLIKDLGRRNSLLSISIIGFIGWILLACATRPDHAYVARILIGIPTGGYGIAIPVYIAEIASKENRGVLGSLFLLMLCLGKLYSNAMGVLFPASIATFLCALHPVVYGLLLLLIPESPSFLLQKFKLIKAQKSYLWFQRKGLTFPFPCASERATDTGFPKLENLKIPIPTQPVEHCSIKISIKKYLTSTEFLKPSITVFVLMLLAQFCGINVTTFYTVELFRKSGDVLLDSSKATVILALIQTIGCIPSSIFVDKYGRKVLLLSSFAAMTVSLAGFSIYFILKETNAPLIEKYPGMGIVPLVSLVVYSLAYSWGIGSMIWIVTAEILPPQIYGPVSSFANVLYWGAAFLVTQAFQLFHKEFPLYVWFVSFSLVSTFGFIFVSLFLPETKGLSLQEIANFYRKSRTSNAHLYKMEI